MTDSERVAILSATLRVFADRETWERREECGFHGCPQYPGIVWSGPASSEEFFYPWDIASLALILAEVGDQRLEMPADHD